MQARDFPFTRSCNPAAPEAQSQRTAYPIKWVQSPAEGEYEARVELSYGGRRETWRGTFRVGEAVAEGLVERGAPGRVQEASDPLPLLAAAAGAAGALAALPAALVLRRRSSLR